MLRKALVPVFCGILPGLTATAADPVFVRYKVTGEAPFDLLGRSVASLGDVDGDAVPDFAAGAPEWTGAPAPAGRIVVVSGRDGRIVRTLRNETGGSNFGAYVASAGDLDADGAQDILLTAHGLVEVRSGRTGELLLRIEEAGEEPRKALGIGDADVDGVPDLAVSYRDFPISRLAVRSGQTGDVFWGSEGRLDEFAWSFAALGDADGDGSPDLAIGEPALGRASEPGSIRVLRGKDGTTIYSVESIPAGKSFGFSLAMLSDVDGNGVGELAVGSEAFGFFDQERLGRVDVVSGRTGSPPVWNRTGRDFDRTGRGSAFLGDRFGAQVGNAGNADGDGADDLLVWSPRDSQGMNGPVDDSRVHLHSGRTGALLAVYEAEEREAHFGWGLQRLGDVDGDGRSEFLDLRRGLERPRRGRDRVARERRKGVRHELSRFGDGVRPGRRQPRSQGGRERCQRARPGADGGGLPALRGGSGRGPERKERHDQCREHPPLPLLGRSPCTRRTVSRVRTLRDVPRPPPLRAIVLSLRELPQCSGSAKRARRRVFGQILPPARSQSRKARSGPRPLQESGRIAEGECNPRTVLPAENVPSR